MSGKITIPKKIEENRILGENNADNNFSTSLVNANSTGTVIERIASIQTAIGSAASQLKVSKSISSSVEEGGFLQFSVSFIDIDSGVISSDNINITSITQEMARSTLGGVFTSTGITQPVFEKSNGVVNCSYSFLEDEWQNGDMYRMTISGITVTIGDSTAYIEIQQWSGEVTDDIDLTAKLVSIITKLATGAGVVQIATTTEDLNQAAAIYDLLTGTTQAVMLETLSFKMPAVDISGGALTYITIQTDDVTPQVVFNSTDGALANLTSEAEISWTGVIRVNVGTKLQLTIAGGAAGTACSATVIAGYKATVAGGTLA